MYALNNFLLSQFIWSITWGMYHIPFNIFWMFLLFKFWERMKLLPSIVLTLLANAFSWLVLCIVVRVFVVWLFDFEYILVEGESTNTLHSCLQMGATYAVLQIIFFIGAAMRIKRLHIGRICIVVIMSNLMTSILVYKLLP